MSIYRRGKVWWSRLMRDGIVVQQSLGTRNRQEALDIEATLRSAAVKGEFGIVDRRIKAYPKSKFQFLLPFLVDTGLRVSEACNLKRDDLDFKQGFVKVVEGKSKAAKREVPLTDRAVTAAKAAWERSRCSYVFTAHGGRKALTRHYVSQQFRVLADTQNMSDAVLHSTRHTFCTRLGESGVDAFTIQKLAGHASITISQRYVHQNREVMVNAIQRMDRANNPPATEPTEQKQEVEKI